MTQLAMNMHTSQISHGIVNGDDFAAADDNVVVVGYTPAMVKIIAVEANDAPQDMFHWYAVEEDYIFRFNATNEARHDSFIETNERGFTLDGAALIAASGGTPVGFIFETYGCEYGSSGTNAAAADGDDAMDFIDPYLPDLSTTEESESESESQL